MSIYKLQFVISQSNSSLGSWTDVDKRRIFFEQYAKDNGFNHANPESWYAQPPELIMSAKVCLITRLSFSSYLFLLFIIRLSLLNHIVKGAAGVVKYHKNLAQALVDLFPEIGLEKQRFGEQCMSPLTLSINFKYINIYMILNYNHLPYFRSCYLPHITDLWNSPSKRRRFFENFAKANGFDPYTPESWYALQKEKILVVKVSK